MAEWFENDQYWEATYLHNFSDSRFRVAEAEAEQVLKLTGYQSGDILDLACGPGTHVLPLARRGYQVTGVDRTKYLLERAQAASAGIKPAPRFVQQDIRDFVMPDSFSLALFLGNSLGFSAADDADVAILRNAHASLKPGGALVVDTLGKEVVSRNFQPTTSSVGSDGSLLVLRHAIVRDWTRTREDWILLSKERVRRFQFEYSLFSGQELKALLNLAGFSEVALYGEFDGRDYGVRATRLIALARKTA